jgi:hypothetical protein
MLRTFKGWTNERLPWVVVIRHRHQYPMAKRYAGLAGGRVGLFDEELSIHWDLHRVGQAICFSSHADDRQELGILFIR